MLFICLNKIHDLYIRARSQCYMPR